MKIGVASDHRGFDKKEKIKKYLTKRNITFVDYGCNTKESVDYTDYAYELCKGILNGEIDKGILVCATGTGMSIVANKVKGIMCAKVSNSEEAKLSILHNNVNVISFSSKLYMFEIKDIIDEFLKNVYKGEDRFERRIAKIKDIEKMKSYK